MSVDNFRGEILLVSSLTVVTPGGSPVTVPFQGIIDLTPPARQVKKSTYTPISGALAGKEQITLCSVQAVTIEFKGVYEATRYAAIDDVVGINGCAVTLQLSDGSSYVGVGGVEKLAPDQISDSKEHMTSLSIAMGGDYVYDDGSNITKSMFSLALVAGAKTLDLTAIPNSANPAAPIDGTGKAVISLILTNPATNANSITVAKGASNGYTGFGSAFSVTIQPGESVNLASTTAVGGSVKTLDISGTGTQSLSVQIGLQ